MNKIINKVLQFIISLAPVLIETSTSLLVWGEIEYPTEKDL